MWKLANWKGGLDQWKNGIDEWKNDVKIILKDLQEAVAVIKSASEKDATKNGMIQRRSPLVPSEKAIAILEELNIISQVDANISYIQEEIDKRSLTSIYRDIEDPEERFIEIAPSVIHALIKKGKIEEKKIDEAMKKLEEFFPVVTYYGVLLLIAAYILEKRRDKGFITKPSMIYSQIDMTISRDLDELLASFDGDADKAIRSLEMSIRSTEQIGKTGELAINKNKLAALYESVGKLDEAENELRETIKINPNIPLVHFDLGILLGKLKRFEEAEKEYREAIRINPGDAGVHYNLGILHYELKRFEEAEKEYKEAIRIKTDFARAHNNLGVLLGKLKRFEEAEKEYKEAIKVKPNIAEFHVNLGDLYFRTGRSEEAKEELEIAKRLFEAQGREEDVKKAEELLNSFKKRK